jgi:hypothetical protein
MLGYGLEELRNITYLNKPLDGIRCRRIIRQVLKRGYSDKYEKSTSQDGNRSNQQTVLAVEGRQENRLVCRP